MQNNLDFRFNWTRKSGKTNCFESTFKESCNHTFDNSFEISTKSYHYLKEYLKDLVDRVDTDALDDTDERLDNTDEGPSDRIFVVDLLQIGSFD